MESSEYEYTELIAETEAAYLVEIEGEQYWLPKSQCEIDEEDETIEIPDWLAREKGL